MLNRALKEHRPHAVIAELKAGSHTKKVNQPDDHFISPLQYAAQNGMSESLLWLMASGADVDQAIRPDDHQQGISNNAKKMPLYLALEHNQWFNAQILLACGADKDTSLSLAIHLGDDAMVEILQALQLDKDILQSILCWSVFHYQEHTGFHLLQCIEKTISNAPAPLPLRHLDGEEKEYSYSVASEAFLPSTEPHNNISLNDVHTTLDGLIEYAMQKNLPSLVTCLIRMNDGRFRSDRNIATLGFWEARNPNLGISTLLNNTTEQTIAKLHQLNDIEDSALFLKSFTAASIDQGNAYLESSEDLTYPAHFTPRQCKIYFAANYQLSDFITIFSTNHSDDCLTVLEYTVSIQHYSAYATLAANFTVDTQLAHAISTENTKLLFLVMFHQNCFAYEIAEKHPVILNSFLQTLTPIPVSEREGLLYRMISHGSVGLRDTRDQKTIALHKKYISDNHFTQNDFLTIYSHLTYHRNDITDSQEILRHLAENAVITLYEISKRFGFDFSSYYPITSLHDNSLFTRTFLTSKMGPSQIIFDMLDDNSKSNLACVSTLSYRLRFNIELDVYNRFLNSLALEIETFTCWDYRNTSTLDKRKIIFMLAFIISAIGLSVSAYCIHQLIGEKEDTLEAMQHQATHNYNQNCFSYLDELDGFSCKDPSRFYNYDDICRPFCDTLRDNFYKMLSSGLGCAFSSLSLLICLGEQSALKGFYELMRAYWEGDSRFKNLSLTSFSPALQSETSHILEALAEAVTEPQPDAEVEPEAAVVPLALTLHSSVLDLEKAILARKEAIQAAKARYTFFVRQQQSLQDEKPSVHIIEIQEDEEEEKQALLPRVS